MGEHITDTVIPICVDPGAVQPAPAVPEAPNLLFVGGMNWPPNLDGVRWFADEIWPLLRALVPEALGLCRQAPAGGGRRPTPYPGPGLCGGSRPLLALGSGLHRPIAGGRGHAGQDPGCLDAGPARGLHHHRRRGAAYQDGENILIADTPQDFAEALARVLGDADLAQRLGITGALGLPSIMIGGPFIQLGTPFMPKPHLRKGTDHEILA
jgi:hypothetical protein